MTKDVDFNECSDSCPVPPYSWRPVDTLLPGMTLARRVVVEEGRRVMMMLAEGSILTEGMIAQLVSKAVECVAVLNNHPQAASDYLALKQAYEIRLRLLFGCHDSPLNEDCRPLFDILVALGPPR
ncbi:MAG: hypothetical protein Q7W05_05350 [Deltaproteobacteria bacterium]|nr:hypothetical protein [Deltaproteobacteria bacterium]